MTNKRITAGRIGATLLLALGAIGQAQAAGCTVSSSGLVFGAYRPLSLPGRLVSEPATSTASVSIVCVGIVSGGAYSISLGPSTVGSGDRISTRYLANASGGDFMAFNVFRELAHATVWGDGIIAGSTIGGALGAGDSNHLHTVYGRIPEGQSTLRAGSYSDTLTITLTYNP